MRSNYLVPIINCPTRYAPDQLTPPSLIDHIWINFVGFDYTCGVIVLDHTDHCPIYINIKTEANSSSRVKIKFRNFSEENQLKFKEQLASITWDISMDDVDLMFDRFSEII